ncbi:hypothetical protein [Prosthecobacter sp.]
METLYRHQFGIFAHPALFSKTPVIQTQSFAFTLRKTPALKGLRN